MDPTLKHHEEMIYEHDEDLCHIRQDLVDIKTRLGIKDLTNGQVKDYQKQLVKSLEEEKKSVRRMISSCVRRLNLWIVKYGIFLQGLFY